MRRHGNEANVHCSRVFLCLHLVTLLFLSLRSSVSLPYLDTRCLAARVPAACMHFSVFLSISAHNKTVRRVFASSSVFRH